MPKNWSGRWNEEGCEKAAAGMRPEEAENSEIANEGVKVKEEAAAIARLSLSHGLTTEERSSSSTLPRLTPPPDLVFCLAASLAAPVLSLPFLSLPSLSLLSLPPPLAYSLFNTTNTTPTGARRGEASPRRVLLLGPTKTKHEVGSKEEWNQMHMMMGKLMKSERE